MVSNNSNFQVLMGDVAKRLQGLVDEYKDSPIASNVDIDCVEDEDISPEERAKLTPNDSIPDELGYKAGAGDEDVLVAIDELLSPDSILTMLESASLSEGGLDSTSPSPVDDEYISYLREDGALNDEQCEE